MKVSHFMSRVLVEPQGEAIPSKGRFRDTAVDYVALNRDLDVNAFYAWDIFLRILASLYNQAVERMLVGGIACESDRHCVVVVVNTANIGRKLVTRSIFFRSHSANPANGKLTDRRPSVVAEFSADARGGGSVERLVR